MDFLKTEDESVESTCADDESEVSTFRDSEDIDSEFVSDFKKGMLCNHKDQQEGVEKSVEGSVDKSENVDIVIRTRSDSYENR